MTRRTATRQRGTVYLLVLVVTAMLVGIGVTAVMVGRIDVQGEALQDDMAQARQLGLGGLEVVRKRLESNSGWRSTYTNDVWSAPTVVGDGVCVFKLVDEGDGSLLDDDTDPVRVYVKATVGSAVRIYSVVIEMASAKTVEVPIVRSTDDGGQSAGLGISSTSVDYMLIGQDGLISAIAGVRFDDLPIAAGGTVQSAQIQFTSKDNRSDATAISIQAEAEDNAQTIVATPFNISSRTKTTEQAVWGPGAWVADARGAEQLTPDLSAVMQEVIDRAGWREGNAVVFILEGTKARNPRTFDHDPAQGPVLHLTYLNPGYSVDYTTLRRELAE
ncbi:hypothetical protein OT109_14910 [Phycisphaeraceae bacterium D3-23]